MKLLGIDYGKKKIGLAISEFGLASGWGELNTAESLVRIQKIIIDEKIEQIVIGLPNDRLQDQVKQFGKKLKEISGLNIIYWDETLTSSDARGILIKSGISRKRRKNQEHQVAAGLILQSYIDQNL